MTQLESPHRSFASGEISDALDYRSDLTAWKIGLSRCRNFLVRPEGGVERTPGTRLIAEVKNSAYFTRLIPFVFGNSDAVMIEAGHTYFRFFRDKAPILDAGTPHEVSTDYDSGNLAAIQPVQSADVMWLFSKLKTKELDRTQTAPDRFALSDAVFRNGPFLDRNTDEASTIEASGVTGSVTLTATDPIFSPLHIGSYFRLEEKDLSDVPTWVGNNAYTFLDQVRSAGNVYEARNSATSSPNAPSHEEGDLNDGDGVTWRYLHSGFGIVKVTAYTDAYHVTAEVQPYKQIPDQCTYVPTWKWREGAWSDYRGWPSVGALFDNRLVGGATPQLPYWTWYSAIQGFDDFEDGTLDDQGISRPLFNGTVDPIRWMVPGPVLLCGTDGAEWYARAQTGQKSVTPSNLETKPTTVEGCSLIRGVRLNDRALFVDASTRRLVSWFYDFGTDSYTTEDLSVMASHLLGAAVVDIAWQKRPNRILWCLMGDGTLTGFTYHPIQNVLAWHSHDFGDPVEAIATLPAGDHDDLYMVVNRKIGGANQRLVEVMEQGFRGDAGDAVEDAWYLMSAVLTTGSGLTTITGLDHLEGRSVTPFVDGVRLNNVTVAGGEITLSRAGDKVLVGLAQTSYIRTLDIDFGEAAKAYFGRRKQLTGLKVGLKDSWEGYARSGRREHREALFPAGALVAAPTLFNGLTNVSPPEAIAEVNQVDLEFDGPYPAQVTGLMPLWED